jgi:hypothetical protein
MIVQVEELVKNASLTQYQGTPQDDVRVLEWYKELLESGELFNLVFPSAYALGGFFTMLRKSYFFYGLDEEDRIWFSSWFEPATRGVAFMSMWARREKRNTKKGVAQAYAMYKNAFKLLNVILGVTKQERLLKVHKRAGYEVVSKIPMLWGGVEDAWLVMLTKENFEKTRW